MNTRKYDNETLTRWNYPRGGLFRDILDMFNVMLTQRSLRKLYLWSSWRKVWRTSKTWWVVRVVHRYPRMRFFDRRKWGTIYGYFVGSDQYMTRGTLQFRKCMRLETGRQESNGNIKPNTFELCLRWFLRNDILFRSGPGKPFKDTYSLTRGNGSQITVYSTTTSSTGERVCGIDGPSGNISWLTCCHPWVY